MLHKNIGFSVLARGMQGGMCQMCHDEILAKRHCFVSLCCRFLHPSRVFLSLPTLVCLQKCQFPAIGKQFEDYRTNINESNTIKI